jgi:peptidoglycan hydrolase-like protein with peptidoglycan-binding domain
MKRFGLFVFVLAVAFCIAGCSKKTESLEEMQQPMSPEDLNRLSTQNEPAIPAAPGEVPQAAANMPTATMPVATELEALPPSGPYKPSAIEIQTALKNSGFYTGSIDGKIGPKTKAAIEEFQKSNGLTADGKVGPKTWQALARYLTQAPAEAVSSEPAVQ